jgi:hypothetical protein
LFGSDGARHSVVPDSPFLGQVPPDTENDGQPSAGADDVDITLDDEDVDGPGGVTVFVGQPLTGTRSITMAEPMVRFSMPGSI